MRALLAAALLALPLAGCIGTFETVQELGWRPGYAFAYELTESGSESFTQYENGTETSSNQASESGEKETRRYQVLSVDDTDGKDPFAVVVAQPMTGGARLRAYRMTDLAEAAVDVDDDKVDIEYVVPASGALRFPLSDGQEYELREDDSDDETFVITVRVEGAEMVDGPQGRVEAIRIVHEVTADPEAMRISFEKSVLDDGGRDIEVEVDVEATRTVWYAPSLHNIVRDEMEAEFAYDVAYTDRAGTRHRDVFEGSFEGVEVLTEATFAVGEDLDGAGILKALQLGAHPGAVLPEGGAGTTLRLTGTGATLGLDGTGTALTVQVAARELQSPVAIELMGPGGTQRTQVPAAGGQVAFTVAEPGIYTWRAASTGDDPRAAAELRVAVDLRDSVQVSCPVASLQGVCGPVEFRLPEGLASLSIEAQRTALVVEPGFATLVVEGPDDDASDTMFAANSAAVSFDEPEAGTYTMRLETTGPADSVTFHVVASPGQTGTPGTVRALMGW